MNYDEFMKIVFWHCVELISITAAFLGLSYEELNVLLFVIAQPSIILCLLILLIWKPSSHVCYAASPPSIKEYKQ